MPLIMAFVLGFTCFIVQLVLLRELLNIFLGNELIIGIVLALWMLITAAGALAGRLIGKNFREKPTFFILLLLTGSMPVAGAFLSIWLRTMFFAPGAMASLQGVVLISLAGIAAFCISSGMMFTLLAAAVSNTGDRGGISRIYAIEALGSLVGGIIFNFLLVYLMNSLRILSLILLVNILLATWYAFAHRRTALAGFGLLAAVMFTILSLALNPDDLAARLLYPGQDILQNTDTPFGKLVVTERGAQVQFYQSGQAVAVSDNVQEKEEKIHYAMSLHHDPKAVLMLAGGLDGAVPEIVKYGVHRIDYVDPDPWLVAAASKHAGLEWPDEVNVYYCDPGRFLDTVRNSYDVIILNAPPPLTVGNNRFYTEGFFERVKRGLKQGGIFSTGLPASGNYLDEGTRMLYSTVWNTMKRHFTQMRLVAGNRSYFIASDSTVDGKITEMIASGEINTVYVNRWYLDDRLMDDRARQIMQAMDDGAQINTDFHPLASHLSILRWLEMFHVPAWLLAMIPVLLMIVVLIRLSPLDTGLFAGGFTAASAEFLLMIAFQFMYGFIYQVAGIIIMAFMAGLASGSGYLYRFVPESKRSFIMLQLLIGAFIGLMPLMLMWLDGMVHAWLPALIICLLTFVAAAITGVQYRIATKLHHGAAKMVASSTYGADLAGSAFGAFLVAVFVFPMAGMIITGLMLAGINFITAAYMQLRI